MNPVAAQLHDGISRSVVQITIRPPLGNPRAFKRTRLFGFIVVLAPNFAYVVAHPKYFSGKQGGRFRVEFMGHAEIDFDAPEIHLTQNICGICFRNPNGYDTQLIEEIKLCETELRNSQVVYVYDPALETITSGSIIGINDTHFQTNCAATTESENGAVVINDNREMVGLCTSFQNLYLTAISAESIAIEVDTFQRNNFTSIGDALRRLRNYN